ncbi:hypothetical protein STENM327S_07954 [Streptomyces tendae]
MVGTVHGVGARVDRGHEVVQIERGAEARGTSLVVGKIWVSGRAGGEELETALRARELWEEIGGRIPALGFRPNGSLTPLPRRPGARHRPRRPSPARTPPPAATSCSPPMRPAP